MGEVRVRKPVVRFSAKVGRVICRRVASGESVSSICRGPEMPTNGTVSNWARTLPAFGRALSRAKNAAGWSGATSPGAHFDEAQAVEIYARICEGEPLSKICADPRMPGHSTVYRWRGQIPEFASALRVAREVQAEVLCERGMAVAEAVTPETAYATHVRLTHLRWMAGLLGPKHFGRTKPVEADVDEAESGGFTVVIKRFTDPPELAGDDLSERAALFSPGRE